MIGLALPLVVVGLGAVVLSLVHRRARPAVATVALTVAAVAAAVASIVLLALYAVAFSLDPDRMAFCRWLIGGHHAHEPHDPTIGVAFALVLALVGLRMRTALRGRQRALAAARPHGPARNGVHVLATEDAIAFAHPAGGGTVVVSRGVLAPLEPEERLVVVAHERAHLQLRHHRYLALVDLAAAAVPLLRPLARAVRLHAERWADEATARAVGDRRLVATTIARVALATHPAPLPGASGHVVARVAALLEEPSPRRSRSALVLLSAVVVVAGSLAQVHHLGDFLWHLA